MLHYRATLYRHARLVGASEMHERVLETREPRATKPFFIPMVHIPPGGVGHVTAPEFPSYEG
jgi:hypothetical protein